MFVKAFGFFVGMFGYLVLVFIGGWAVWHFDRLPTGWPNYRVTFIPFVHPTIHFPESLGAKLSRLEAAEAAAAKHNAVVVQRQGQITQAAQSAAVASRVQIQWRTRTLIQQVHDVVTPDVDRRYPLPVGLVRVFNAAFLGHDLSTVPDPAGRADDAPSGVEASTAGTVFAYDGGECLVDRDRLTRLQDWASAQGTVK